MPNYTGPLPFEIDSPELSSYLSLLVEKSDFTPICHPNYKAQVDHALELAVHARKDPGMNNPKARALIDNARPNELEAVKEHRVKNYRQVTHPQWERIENTIYKIFNPRLTAIHYNVEAFPKNAPETLETYLDEVVNLEEFIKSRAFPETLRDCGGVVAVLPLESSMTEDVYTSPVPVFFPSDRVLDYSRGNYYLLHSRRKSEMKNGMTGDVLFLIDRENIHLIYEVDGEKPGKRAFEILPQPYYRHAIGVPPVAHLPGVIEEQEEGEIVWSFCSGVLPNWNEALCSKSDFQAVKLRHAFPRHWQIKLKCPKCRGTGTETTATLRGGSTTCSMCDGSGITEVAKGPTDSTIVDAKALENGNFPLPPEGYIEPDGSTLEFLRRDVDIEISKGFEALNMDQNQKSASTEESGEKLKQDRDRLNTFLDKIRNGVYGVWQDTAYFIAAMRYGTIADPKLITPRIKGPKTYDLKSTAEHAQSIKTAKEAGLDPNIVAKEELDYIRKEYGEDSEVYIRTKTATELDPLPGLKPEDSIQVEGYARKEDLWVHFNLYRLIGRAADETPNFFQLPRPKKLEIIYGYAKAETAAVPRMPTPE